MSLVSLHAEVQGYRDQASELASEFSRVHAEVAEDPNLTPNGRRERLEPLHYEVSAQMRALHDREKAAVRTEKENIERRVFGLSPSASTDPAKIVSFRDAQARARELEDSDAATELYESAVRSGDDILAAAVLEKALIRGWSAIKDDYLERHTTTGNDLEDLEALARFTNNSLAATAQYMPPRLNLPHSAGFPDTQLHKAAKPTPVPSVVDQMRNAGLFR